MSVLKTGGDEGRFCFGESGALHSLISWSGQVCSASTLRVTRRLYDRDAGNQSRRRHQPPTANGSLQKSHDIPCRFSISTAAPSGSAMVEYSLTLRSQEQTANDGRGAYGYVKDGSRSWSCCVHLSMWCQVRNEACH